MAERIQEIRHSKMKKKDPMKEEKCMEVMQILDKVKEEHGERGLGLTFIYSLGMRTCLDFGQPEKVIALFSEVFDHVLLHLCKYSGKQEQKETETERESQTDRENGRSRRSCQDC